MLNCLFVLSVFAGSLPPSAIDTAEHAFNSYAQESIALLGELVRFKTVHQDGVPNRDNPEFKAMSAFLKNKAAALGLEFIDHGDVVVIALGEGPKRLGIVTHGDVQPADPSKWAENPFSLDAKSEPGRLVARGTEDDKGPIATAMYAMKALKDKGIPLKRRIELIISYTEESDWEPFRAYLAENPPPDRNVAIDAAYPVVVAEKGWAGIYLKLDAGGDIGSEGPVIKELHGGVFMSQVPEDAYVVLGEISSDLEASLKQRAAGMKSVEFQFSRSADDLKIKAKGKSAHSSTPSDGVNAISHLADLLNGPQWRRNSPALAVKLINDMVGTGYEAEKFGGIAYRHDFMGPLTLNLSMTYAKDGAQHVDINLRSPLGKSKDRLADDIRAAVSAYEKANGLQGLLANVYTSDAMYAKDVPHVDMLLRVFGHFTGQADPQPLSIGGSTHAKLLPNCVNFGPAMPDEVYTGHSEHEYITRDQFLLNLKMYSAMLVMMTRD